MASNQRIFNESRRWFIKRSQAIGRVEHCVSAWVEFGVSIRDLSLAESNAKRSEQAQKPLGLVYMVEGKDGKLLAKPFFAELPNCVYRPAEQDQAAHRQGYELVKAANQFAEMQA